MMQHAESFRDLLVYQKSRKVAWRFFDLSQGFPKGLWMSSKGLVECFKPWWTRLTYSVVHLFAVFVKAQSSTSSTEHRLRITDHLSSYDFF